MKYIYYALAGIASIQIVQLIYASRQYLETRAFRMSTACLLREVIFSLHKANTPVEPETEAEAEEAAVEAVADEAAVPAAEAVEAVADEAAVPAAEAVEAVAEEAAVPAAEAAAAPDTSPDEESSGEAAYVDDYIGRDMSKDDPDVLWSRSFGGEMEARDN